MLIEGSTWAGKSTLLRALVERAAGWRVVPARDEPFVVHLSTTSDDLTAALHRALTRQDAWLAEPPRDPLRVLGRVADRVLLLIDDYNPSTEFDAWFRTSFWPRARTRAGLVIVVTGREETLAPLHEIADDRLPLGGLDPDAVHDHLSRLGASTRPALTPEQVETLTGSVAARPDLVGALIRLLQLLPPSA